MAHPNYIMRADDVGSWSRCMEQHPFGNFSIDNVLGQAVVFRAGPFEGIKEQNVHIVEPPLSYVLGGLLQPLSPIDIRIVEECRSAGGAPRHFVEVGNIVWESRNTRPRMPRKECPDDCRSRSGSQKLRDDPAHPDEKQREYRKNVANTDL